MLMALSSLLGSAGKIRRDMLLMSASEGILPILVGDGMLRRILRLGGIILGAAILSSGVDAPDAREASEDSSSGIFNPSEKSPTVGEESIAVGTSTSDLMCDVLCKVFCAVFVLRVPKKEFFCRLLPRKLKTEKVEEFRRRQRIESIALLI